MQMTTIPFVHTGDGSTEYMIDQVSVSDLAGEIKVIMQPISYCLLGNIGRLHK